MEHAKHKKRKGIKPAKTEVNSGQPTFLAPISLASNIECKSSLTNYTDDWEEEDIYMRTPSPVSSVTPMSIDRSITALEPLESPRRAYLLGTLQHRSEARLPHESNSETSPNNSGCSRPTLPPISMTNLPTSHRGTPASVDIGTNKKRENSLHKLDSSKQEKILDELRDAGIVKNPATLCQAKGGIAFSVEVKDGMGPRKPPHFLEKLPAISPRQIVSEKKSWQNLIEAKQRRAEEQHEEYIQQIAEKGRERSARRRRAADKLREQMQQSRQHIEERLRIRLSTFEENKNIFMKEKLEKIKKMREKEKRARKRLERKIKVLEREDELELNRHTVKEECEHSSTDSSQSEQL